MTRDVARDEWTSRDHAPALRLCALEHRVRQDVRQSPPLKLLGNLGMREHDGVAMLDVGDDRNVPVDVGLELARPWIVDHDGSLLFPTCRFCHLKACLLP